MSDIVPAEGMETKQNGVSGEVVDAIHLIAQGKRNMMCAEVAQAMQQFQEASRILSAQYGEMADECADAYSWYGKALLELARIEGGLLGDTAVTGSETSQSENEESEEQEGTNGEGGMKEGSTAGEEEDEEEGVLSEDIDDEEGEPSKREESGKRDEEKEKEASEADTAASGSGAAMQTEQPQNEDGDDVSNLQLAWEMMELAKVIYSRHDSREMKLKLADTYLKLGEIGMETEQFEQAITDLEHSLTLLHANLAPEDRLIAETLYQLGLAAQLHKQHDAAAQHLRGAARVIEARLALLRRVAAGELQPDAVFGSAARSDGFYSPMELALREIEQLNEIIPDILAKIDDVLDEKKDEEKVRSMMSESVTVNGSSAAAAAVPIAAAPAAVTLPAKIVDHANSFAPSVFQSSTSNQPVNNISHLIRKKRKSTEDESTDAKRVRTEPASSSTISEPSNLAEVSPATHGSNVIVPRTLPNVNVEPPTLTEAAESAEPSSANTATDTQAQQATSGGECLER